MQFTASLTLATAAAMALFVATPAVAADNRILVKYSGSTSTDFCNAWRCACVNYVPKDSSLYFQGTYCQPGDFSGNNRDTEAKVFCTFTNGSKQTAVNKHIAAATKATIVN